MASKKRKSGNRKPKGTPHRKTAGQGGQRPRQEARQDPSETAPSKTASGHRSPGHRSPGHRSGSGSAHRAAQRRAAKRKRQMLTVGLPSAIVVLLVVLAIALNGGAQGGGKVAPAGSIKVEGASLPVPSETNPTPAIGMTVPTFSAPGLNGGTVGWEPGKPTVLTVWAAWCPHCQVELPRLDKIRSRYPGVQVLSINTAQGQDAGPVPADFVAKENITMPVAIDDGAKTLLTAMGVNGFPALYFINSDGTILDQLAGESDDATLQTDFEKLQQQADIASSSPSPSPKPKPSK